jgi:hypothetical protein
VNAGVNTAQVLRQFLPAYRQHHALTPQQGKVAGLLCRCRTEAMSSLDWACGRCGYREIRYRSCRNRHCPQCQQRASADWLAARREDLLPVPYFHVVFTVPHQLNTWAQLHPEQIYAILFKAVWHTLRRFGEDPKRLNGQLGMTAVLHTWGQNLSQHVHLHCLIPGGAYQQADQRWRPARSTYLFPVKALMRVYRGRMVSLLREAYREGQLARLSDAAEVDHCLNELMKTPWVVYARSTCQHSSTVLSYLARYTHRIAISDTRLEAVNRDTVTFRYKDYAAGGTKKSLALKGEEFVRRLLLHVLPHGFMRIRHYGFMANACRRKRLSEIRRCLNDVPCTTEVVADASPAAQSQPSCAVCPQCKQPALRIVGERPSEGRRR